MKNCAKSPLKMSSTTQMLGRRKHRGQILATESDKRLKLDGKEPSKVQALFRQHFEATFEPLEKFCLSSSHQEAIEIQPDLTESEWEGISDEEQVKTQIIEFHGSEMSKTDISKDELKTFMVRFPLQSCKKRGVLMPADHQASIII